MTGDEADLIFFPEEMGPAPELIECWRCGKPVVRDTSCARCGASSRPRPLGETRPKAALAHDRDQVAATRLLGFFAALLATSVLYGWTLHFALDEGAAKDPQAAHRQIYRMLAIEAVDSVLVVAALMAVPRPPAPPRVSTGRRLAAWAASPLMLGLALAANIGYHRLLVDTFKVPAVEDEVVSLCGLGIPVILAYCVQPAIFEELFFRRLALGGLRGVTNVHGAVLASSVMFGMSHIGVPLSIPILTFVGLVLGYARVASGGLALPILLHFAHNLAVTVYHGH